MTRLRQLREEAILTIEELAEISGVSEDAIMKLEKGRRRPRPSTIRKLAKALEVDPRELMYRQKVVVDHIGEES